MGLSIGLELDFGLELYFGLELDGESRDVGNEVRVVA